MKNAFAHGTGLLDTLNNATLNHCIPKLKGRLFEADQEKRNLAEWMTQW